MRYSRDQNINRLVAELVGIGWTYRKGRHGKLRTPDGRYFVTIPCTPSDHRSFLNLKRDLRQVVATLFAPAQQPEIAAIHHSRRILYQADCLGAHRQGFPSGFVRRRRSKDTRRNFPVSSGG